MCQSQSLEEVILKQENSNAGSEGREQKVWTKNKKESGCAQVA